jgi:hypothetical protein
MTSLDDIRVPDPRDEPCEYARYCLRISGEMWRLVGEVEKTLAIVPLDSAFVASLCLVKARNLLAEGATVMNLSLKSAHTTIGAYLEPPQVTKT